MKLEEIKEIIALLEASKLTKICLKKGDFELLLEKTTAKEYSVSRPSPLVERVYEEKTLKEEPKEEKNDYQFILSPMVGTFYNCPSPKEPPFVKVGDKVSEDMVVCIIEAMKVMNEVKAGKTGIVKEVFCKNAQPVEFGTKLFSIELL